MNLKELLSSVRLEKIEREILKIYPDEKSSIEKGEYRRLIDTLTSLPTLENSNNMMLCLEQEENDSWDVSYTLDRRYDHRYPLDFIKLENIASAFVSEADLDTQTSEEYVAHVLWELVHLLEDDSEEKPSSASEGKEFLSRDDILESDEDFE